MLATILATVELPILATEVNASGEGEHNRETGRSNVDDESSRVTRGPVVEVAAPDVGGVAESVDEGDGAGSFGGWLGQGAGYPRQSHDGGGVEGGGEQHHRDVSCGNVEGRDGDDVGD